MRWRKNVLEEIESLDQIIIESLYPNYCVILALSLYLEHSLHEINQQDGKPFYSVFQNKK